MSELLRELNDEQRKAVEHTDGPLFVFAGPGTGKTKVTTHKLAYLIKEKGFRPEEVLALTFSQKAAEEMEGRASALLPGVAGVRISTFHSFCNEILRENALEMGIDANSGVFTEEYQQAFLLENLDDFGLETLPVPTRPIELATTFQGAITRFKQENISVERLEAFLKKKKADKSEEMGNLRDLAKAYRAYEDFKKSRGFLDFGDMQLLALELFEKKPETLKRYQARFRYVIVDEFQDTDFIQLRIIFKLAPSGNLTVVGDDDQSIYRFRGAYLTNVRELDEHYKALGMTPVRKVLEINYRCTPDIQTVATGLITNNPAREKKKMETDKKGGDPVTVTQFKDDASQALGILARVKELHDTGRKYDEMAVLARRRMDARLIQEAFENAGVPFEIIGSREFFGEAVIRAVVAYLRVLEDPQKNQPSLGMVLQRPVHGILPGEVQKLGRYARDKRLSLWEALGNLDDFKGEKQHLQRFRKDMDELFKVKGEKGVYELVRTIVMGRDFLKTEVARRNTGNIRLLNRFLELSARFVDIYPESHLEDFILHLRAFADLGLQDDVREPSAGKLHLMTVHGSKGMEFPIVIIPCLSRDRFPSRWKDFKINVPDELADGVAPEGTPEEVHMQEERRLLYVGITRAKERLFLDFATRYGTNVRETPVSVFLEEIRKAGKGFEEKKVTDELESPLMASPGIEEALHGRLLSSVARGDHQEAIKAVTALAKQSGADLSKLDVPRKLDLDEYAAELELVAKAPEVEHARKAEYSPSKLSQYQKCPKSYFFQYVLEIPGEVKTFFELGTLTHAVIEAITRQLKDGKAVSEKEALALLDRMWKPSVYESKEKEKQDRAEAEDMVKKFLSHQAGKTGTILEIEKFVEMDIEGRKMRGRVDRIDDMGDALQVIDYKSSKNRTSKPELKKDFQMGIYKSAVEAMTGRPVGSVGHWYLRMDQEWMIELGDGELDAIKKRALDIIKNIEKGEFEATGGFQECRYCDYGDLCGQEQ